MTLQARAAHYHCSGSRSRCRPARHVGEHYPVAAWRYVVAQMKEHVGYCLFFCVEVLLNSLGSCRARSV